MLKAESLERGLTFRVWGFAALGFMSLGFGV